jgi:hypothetical protein
MTRRDDRTGYQKVAGEMGFEGEREDGCGWQERMIRFKKTGRWGLSGGWVF